VALPPLPLEEGELDRTGDLPVGYVFKSVNDPFIGQLTYFRIYSGTIDGDTELHNLTKGSKERFGGLMYINGKEQAHADSAGPGEIVAVAKLKNTGLGDVLAGSNENIKFPSPNYPIPTMSYAVYAVAKGDEDKIGTGLHRFSAEDFTFQVRRDDETHETVISGMGDQHLTVMVNRLKSEFKVDVDLQTPKVPYRETITGTGSASYRHKKQTGGHGQFAEVHLRLEHLADGEFEFANEVVGGNIPKNYIPAVEKGVVETMVSGPLANSKVIGVKAIVFDGKHHPVDSSEMAFKIAARGAFREAMAKAKPSILEPIMDLHITFPEEYMGDISGDLNSRRGRILGMNMEEGMQVLNAEVPLAETYSYSTQLRSITQGRGSFEMEFARYEPVPSQLAAKIQEEAAKEAEEE
jgi:elongation factor G